MNEGSHLKRKESPWQQLVIEGAHELQVLFLLTVSFFSMKKTENIGPLIFLLLCSKWARMKLIFISTGNIFEGWNVIPGKNGLEKRECSSAVRGKAHPKNKAKIKIGFNYDSMWLHRVWTKGLHIAGNMWRQIWYLRCESKGYLSDMQLVCTHSFRILHVSFQIIALSGCMARSEIAGSYGDCSHEIKRCLLLGRKAVTNLGSILKSRDIADKGPSNQSYGFSSSHVWMWELDYKESWVLRNWCFSTVVLEKTLESPLDYKEIQPVNPKGNQSCMFIGRTEAETLIVWPPDVKNWLVRKDPDAGKDWGQEEKGMTEDEMVGWHHRLSGHEFE